MAKEAIRHELNVNNNRGARAAHTIRLTCSKECALGGTCHGDALAAPAGALSTESIVRLRLQL